MQNCKVSKIEIHVRCVDASRRQPRTIGGLAADLIQLFTTCLLHTRIAKPYATAPFALVWTNGSMAQPRNSDGQSTVTWGTIRPLPCFRVASASIRWALGGIAGPKPPKLSQTPGPSMPPIVPVYIRRGKRCVSLTPPFPSASFLSFIQPGAVQCLFA